MSLTQTIKNAFSKGDSAIPEESTETTAANDTRAANLAKINESLSRAESLITALSAGIAESKTAKAQLASVTQSQFNVEKELNELVDSGGIENAEIESKVVTLSARAQLFPARIRKLSEIAAANNEALRPLMADVYACVQQFAHRCMDCSKAQIEDFLSKLISGSAEKGQIEAIAGRTAHLTDFSLEAFRIAEHGNPISLGTYEDLTKCSESAIEALQQMPAIVESYIALPTAK